MKETVIAIVAAVISGVVGGAISGWFTAGKKVKSWDTKVRATNAIVNQGNSAPVTTAQSETGPAHAVGTVNFHPPAPPAKPRLVPREQGNLILVANNGGAPAIDPTWTVTDNGNPSEALIPDTPMPNPMQPGVETRIAIIAKTWADGVVTLRVEWRDDEGNAYDCTHNL